MSDAPWWASDGAEDLDRHQDPLASHLSARRGEAARIDEATGDPADGPDPRFGPGDDRPGRDDHADRPGDDADRPGDDADSPRDHDPAICGICPICHGWASLEDLHPDVATNLALAGRHLALALRGLADVVEQAADGADTRAPGDTGGRGAHQGSGGARDTGFRPIILDDTDDDMGEPA